uniref:Rho guanine nucleotide exchange factor 12 n=1 Tax=Nothobranchius furzeri TaxID=105023 RepID=A0A8C6PHT6_NOTFU
FFTQQKPFHTISRSIKRKRHGGLVVSLVQRCVIIQKDENGFGFTVSGDNPVFVQLVNGTLVTQSNHTEVVKLIKSGSYVALTVLGRPPGLAQIPLPEAEPDVFGVRVSSPNSPATERSCSPQDRLFSPQQQYVLNIRYLFIFCLCCQHSYLQGHSYLLLLVTCQRFQLSGCRRMFLQDTVSPTTVSSPLPCRLGLQIIGAEDDYFDSDQEQTNGQCNSFNSIEQLKSRPAHLAAFLHHVISQFDPLCYLYADYYKQTNSKETRKELHNVFIDRAAILKVPIPESVSSDLNWRRMELNPEETNKQYVKTLQDSLLSDIQKNLEDFRQKRSMGLTVAKAELTRLDQERVRDRVTIERERSYAESIISKIDDILFTTQTTEEDKCTTIQNVIYTYMKHLGVRVKEPRILEAKRGRKSFLPKMMKEGEDKGRKVFMLPLRRPSRIDSSPGGTSSGSSRLNDGLQTDLDVFPFPSSPLDVCDQLQEDDSDRYFYGPVWDFLSSRNFSDVQSEDDQGTDSEHNPPNWHQRVGREVLVGLSPHEIKRQEVINELFYTERAHVRMLKVLDLVFYQKLSKDAILPPTDIKNIFTNLEEVLQLHVSILEQMTAVRKRNESSVIDQIGDDLLSWFSGGEEEKIKQAVGTFCSNQPFALEIIKTKQKKDSRFISFIQEAESNRLCRRLQLKDLIPVEMLRLTKYPLLLDNIVKYTGQKVKQAAECCRRILSHVNQAVKESEDKQKLEDYQRRLDLSTLKQTDNPLIAELKNLDLTKRTMIHEGSLSWKVNRDKTIELFTLLLEDILVLLQKQDERLILKCHSKNLAGAADTKHIYSPIIKLSTVLVRSVATDNRSFFVLSVSENGSHIYELMAPTVTDQNTKSLFVICSSVAALKHVLVTQLMSQEAAEQSKRSSGVRLLRTTSLRTPTDNRSKVLVHNGSEKSSSKTEDLAQDLGSWDTGFFESPEDYGKFAQLESSFYESVQINSP